MYIDLFIWTFKTSIFAMRLRFVFSEISSWLSKFLIWNWTAFQVKNQRKSGKNKCSSSTFDSKISSRSRPLLMESLDRIDPFVRLWMSTVGWLDSVPIDGTDWLRFDRDDEDDESFCTFCLSLANMPDVNAYLAYRLCWTIEPNWNWVFLETN